MNSPPSPQFWGSRISQSPPELGDLGGKIIDNSDRFIFRFSNADTSWQTETGGFLLIPLPGAAPTKPGSVTKPFPGILTDVVDLDGNPVSDNAGAYLVVKHPWASMMRTTTAVMSAFAAPIEITFRLRMASICYFTGDGARRDEDGYWGLWAEWTTCSAFRVTASAP